MFPASAPGIMVKMKAGQHKDMWGQEPSREPFVKLPGQPSVEPSFWALSKYQDIENVCGRLEGMLAGERAVRDQPHYLGDDLEKGSSPLGRDQP